MKTSVNININVNFKLLVNVFIAWVFNKGVTIYLKNIVVTSKEVTNSNNE